MLPGLCVVIPLSHPAPHYLSRLKGCLRSLKPGREELDVVIALVRPAKPIPEDELLPRLYGQLLLLAQEAQAAVVTYPWSGPKFPPALTRNVGARWCRRELVTFVDSDAIIHPDAVGATIETMGTGPDTQFVSIKTAMTEYPPGAAEYRIKDARSFESAARVYSVAPGTGCFTVTSLATFQKLGGFDERFVAYGPTDWDFTARCRALGLIERDLTAELGLVNMHVPHARHAQNAMTPERREARRILEEDLAAGKIVRTDGSWGGARG